MATQRIKTPQMIEQPYLRACNEITQLQIEDAKLRDSVTSIRNMIQSKCKDKVCKNCKIFEEQIVSLKNHEKEMPSFLEEKVDRLEEENKVLRQNSYLPNRNDQYYEDNAKTSNRVKPDPQISLYITQLEQKVSYFEEQSKNLQKDLADKNKQKQQDSMRIINLLDEVQNSKREFQNMDRFYQSQSALMQQDKERIVYELTSKLRASQNEANNLKTFLEAFYRQKESLQHNLQAINSESFNLKRQCEHLKILLGQSQNQLLNSLQEQTSKSSQFNTLAQDLSKLHEDNISLSYKVAHQTQINLETNKRLNALQVEAAELKKENFALQSRSIQESETSQEVNYLNKLLQQNKLILDSKEGQISQMNQQIDGLKRQNHSLNDCIQDQFSTIERAERISTFQNDAIKTLERQKQNLTYTLESLQAGRQDLKYGIKNEATSKQELSQKLIEQIQRYGELNNQYQNLEKQLEEFRKLKIQPEKPRDNTPPGQIMRLRSQNDSLSHEILILKSNKKAQQVQIDSLNHELQSNNSLKEARQKQIEAKQRQMDQLIYFNNQMYYELQQIKNENTLLINKIREIESIIYQLEQNNAVLAKQEEQLQRQKIIFQQLANSLKKENQSLIQHQQPQKQVFLQQLSSLENQLAQAKLQNTEKQRLYQTERQSNIVLLNHKKQMENLNSQLASQNSRLKSRESQLLNQIKQQLSLKQTQISQLKSQLRQKNEKINNNFNQADIDLIKLQELYDENVQKYEKLAESQRISNENIIYLKEKLESMNKVYSQNNDHKDHQQLLKELNKKKQTITELLTNFKYLQKTLNKKQSELDILTQEHQKYCKQAQRQKLEMTEKLSLRQKQISALKRQREEQSRQSASKFKDMQKQIHNLQDETKQKQKTYNDDKRKLEKEFAILTEEKRKREQSTTRQIINLKQSLQTQKKRSIESSLNSSPVKGDDPKKKQKQIDTLKKTVNQNATKIAQLQKQINQKSSEVDKLRQQRKMDQELMRETNEQFSQTLVHLDVKQKQLQQALKNNKKLLEQINAVKSQLSKKTIELEKIKQQIIVKQKQHSLLQQNIRNIELKYQQLNKQTTEKNLSYDYQWMQLDESKKKVHNLEKQLNENKKYLETIKQKGQELRDSRAIYSPKRLNSQPQVVADISGGIQPFDSDKIIQDLNIKRVESFTEQVQNGDAQVTLPLSINKVSFEEFPASSIESIYFAHENVIPQEQKVEMTNSVEKNVNLEGEIKEVQKKNSAKNLLFQQTLSDAVSDAEQNDEINEMLTNKDSDHRSHQQLSIEAFSEYSRIKSTRSELNHKQVEEQYKNKIKTAKMLSKLSKPSKKK